MEWIFDAAKIKKNTSAAELFAWCWTGLQKHAWLISAHKSSMVYLLSQKERKKERERNKQQKREKDCLLSRGRLRVANHPIIWIKQVAPHWESSLKWRSILALGCLWKLKHISCLDCSNFSNTIRRGRGEAFALTLNNWMFGCRPVKIYFAISLVESTVDWASWWSLVLGLGLCQ